MFSAQQDDSRLADINFRDRGWGQVHGKKQSGSDAVFFDLRRHGEILQAVSQTAES